MYPSVWHQLKNKKKLRIFYLHNQPAFSKKSPIFWPSLEPNIILSKAWFKKAVPEIICCKFSVYFKSFIRNPFGRCWIDLYSLAWNICQNISIFQFWCVYQIRYDQVWTWLRKLSLCRLPCSILQILFWTYCPNNMGILCI